MLIGIISESTNEKKRVLGMLKRRKIEDVVAGTLPCRIIATEIFCRGKKISGKIENAAQRLRENGAERIILSRGLKKYRDMVNHKIWMGEDELYRCFPDCVRVVSEKCGINLLKSEVCISATKMDRISEYLLQNFCYDTKKITIYTEDSEAAETVCGKFYDDTGLSVHISRDIKKADSADILVDVDKRNVRIGRNIVVDHAEFDLNIEKYSIDVLDIVTCLKGFDWVNTIKSYKDRKNRLTLFKN